MQSDPAQGSSGPNPAYMNQRTGSWPQPIQHSVESPEVQFSAPVQNGAGLFGQAGPQNSSFDNHGSAHQQRGGPQGPSTSGPAHPPAPRNAHTPTPSAQPGGMNGSAAQQANMEKRGPVEFNHAISYVNKIKVRNHPHPQLWPWLAMNSLTLTSATEPFPGQARDL